MWQRLKVDDSEYLMKHCVNENLHKVLVTNFIELWFEEISESDLLKRCKEMNKFIEASDDVLLSNVLSLFDVSKSDVTRTISSACGSKILGLQSNLEGFKFKIKILLAVATNLQMYEEVTLQLLSTILELEKRQHNLVEVIKSKDLEISEYKLEGAQISRKAVETVQFDLDAFSAKCAEGLSDSKSSVIAQPSTVLTPFVQDLMAKLSTAPVYRYKKNQDSVEEKLSESKRKITKLKSPIKNKKLKMYEDDDEDSSSSKNSERTKNEEVKVKQECQSLAHPSKGRSKHKLQKVLPL